MFETKLLNDEVLIKLVGPLNAKTVSEPSDKRKSPRFAVEFDLKCQGLNEKWQPVGVPFKGKTMNLSRGGVLFETKELVDAPLVDMQILHGHDVLAEATINVVRHGQGIIAGQFVSRV